MLACTASTIQNGIDIVFSEQIIQGDFFIAQIFLNRAKLVIVKCKMVIYVFQLFRPLLTAYYLEGCQATGSPYSPCYDIGNEYEHNRDFANQAVYSLSPPLGIRYTSRPSALACLILEQVY